MITIPKALRHDEISFVLIEAKGKRPFQQAWQKKRIKYNNTELYMHLHNGGNYGVMGGGEKHLVIIDFDNEQTQKDVVPKLPETFTVKTGSGLLHKYFFSDASDSFKIFAEDMSTLADIQGEGKQVVGAGSIHPNGNTYELIDDKPIATMSYGEISSILKALDKKPKKIIKSEIKKTNFDGDDIVEQVKHELSIGTLLSELGVDTNKNPTECLFHSSKGGKCLGWKGEVAHCFHCDESWNIFSLYMQYKKCDFKTALERLCEIANLTDKLKESRKEYINKKKKEAIKVFTTKNQASTFNNIQPIFYDKSGMFWLWNTELFCWEISDDVDILNMISDSTGQDVISSKNRTEILNALKQEGRKNIPKDVKPTWIQFKDLIYDIETGDKIKATPEFFVTNPIPWEVNNDPRTPKMDKIFREWVGENNIQLLKEILAYSLLPDYPINRLFCFIGSGMNGKSCFLNLLRKFIGHDNICSTELDTLMNSRFEVTRLNKKLVCMMGETNFNEMSKTSIIKKLTGQDLIGFEYKNKTPFEGLNYAKIIIATNNLPTTTDKTIGFYRRWCIIDFPNQFNEKKDILADIPEEEYNSLATNSIIILNGLLEKREFTNEGTVEERKENYESHSNFLEKFLNQFTMQDFNSYITKANFYKKFKEWCKENNFREMSETSLAPQMKKLGVESEKKYFNWMHDGKGGQARVWNCIKWRE